MSGTHSKPKRKNPMVRTRVPLTPPTPRSRRAYDLTQAAAVGRFALHQCGQCSMFCYPAPEACPNCLSADLTLSDAPTTGEVLSITSVDVPADNYFRERAPWVVGLVKLDCGPTAICHLHPACGEEMKVNLQLKLDKAGQAVFYGAPADKNLDFSEDKQWREMTAHPRNRRILISDGRHPITASLVKKLNQAGAEEIYIGVSDDWKPHPHLKELARSENVFLVPLAVADEKSVEDLARDYGAKIEILVNTADHVRPGDLLAANQMNAIKDTMELLVFGPMRLARALAPTMRWRGADGARSAVAWVNLLSVFGRAHAPGLASYSISQAAAHALSVHIRAELAQGGVRLLNVTSGPTEDEWYQTFPQPKVRCEAIADAILLGLTQGLEELHVGEYAKDLMLRLETNAKAVEREFSAEKAQGV